MRGFLYIVTISLTLLISACSTLNSEFSCNLTAGDRCLSMDEVNAMTEEKEALDSREYRPAQKTKRVWLSPWKDSKGQAHPGGFAYLEPKSARG